MMVGVCDRKVRKERGMIFQDKSFVGHGLYALYSIRTNSCIYCLYLKLSLAIGIWSPITMRVVSPSKQMKN